MPTNPSIVDYGVGSTYTTPLGAVSWNSGSAPTSGKYLIALVQCGGAATITPPSGWNTLYNPGPAAGNGYVAVGLFWKAAGGSEPTSLTWTSSQTGYNMEVCMLSIAGAMTTQAPQWSQTTASASSITTPSLAPNSINELVLAGFAGFNGVTGFSVGTGWTDTGADSANVLLSGWIVDIQSMNSLSTTTSVSASSTASGSVTALNAFLIIIPSITQYKTLTASLSPVATMIKKGYRIDHSNYHMSFHGSVLKLGYRIPHTNYHLFFTGYTVRHGYQAVFGGLSYTGKTFRKAVFKVASAVTSFAGNIASRFSSASIKFNAAMSYAGKTLRKGFRIPHNNYHVGFAGSVLKYVSGVKVSGALNNTAVMLRKGKIKVATATTGLAGAIQRKLVYIIRAQQTFVGFLKRQGGIKFKPLVQPSGSLTRKGLISIKPTLSFAGSVLRRLRGLKFSAVEALAGSLSEHPLLRALLTAGMTFTGIKPIRKGIAKVGAALNFVGRARRTAISQTMSAGLSFIGNGPQRVMKVLLPAVVSFTGFTRRILSVLFSTPSINLLGRTTRKIGYTIASASLTFVGHTARRMQFKLVGSLSYVGHTIRKAIPRVGGVLVTSGFLKRTAIPLFSAGITFIGKTLKKINFKLIPAAAISFAGSIKRFGYRIDHSNYHMSFHGAIKRQGFQAIAASLTNTGLIVRKLLNYGLSAGLSFSGATYRTIRAKSSLISGTMLLSGRTMRTGIIKIFAGNFLVGGLRRQANVLIQASETLTGNVKRFVTQQLNGVISYAGFIYVPGQGPVFFGQVYLDNFLTGSVLIDTAANFPTLSASNVVYLENFQATMLLAGSVKRKVLMLPLQALLTFTGKFKFDFGLIFHAAVSFTGHTPIRKALAVMNGGLSFVGHYIRKGFRIDHNNYHMSFGGQVSRKAITKPLGGVLSFLGSVPIKKALAYVTGSLSFVGRVRRKIFDTPLTAGLSFTGISPLRKVFSAPLSAAMSITGFLGRFAKVHITAVMSYAGKTTRSVIVKPLTASLSFSGRILRKGFASVAGSLSFVGITPRRKAFAIVTGGLSYSGSVLRKAFAKLTTAVLSFTGLMTPAAKYSSLVIADSASLYYKLNESSGTTATDSSGNSNTGTYTSTGVTYGVNGLLTRDSDSPATAVTLDGSAGYIYSSANYTNTQMETFTYELWFETTTSSGGVLMAGGTTSSVSAPNRDRIFYMNTSGQLNFMWNQTSLYYAGATSSSYNDGNRHHAVLTFIKTGNVVIYVDGVAQVTTSAGNNTANNYPSYIHIGATTFTLTGGGGTYFNGTIEKAALYASQILSATRVAAHYNAGIGAA